MSRFFKNVRLKWFELKADIWYELAHATDMLNDWVQDKACNAMSEDIHELVKDVRTELSNDGIEL